MLNDGDKMKRLFHYKLYMEQEEQGEGVGVKYLEIIKE